ncbi:MAG: hypothetical protein ACOZBX_02300, partial [Campylobacterota bacterium]
MSFKIKTILFFLGVSLVPYIATMFLLGNSFREEQYNAVTAEMNTQLRLTVERIDQHLATLQKDMAFIAKSDLMNDMYTLDLDRRIGNTLLAKKNDMKLQGDFYAVDLKNRVIASSDFAMIGKSAGAPLFYSVPITSAFTGEQIGWLRVDYRMENFSRFFSNTPQRHYYLRHQNGKVDLRPSVFGESLQVARKLSSNPELTVVLEEEKAFAYRLLYKYERWFLLLLV